MYGIIATWRMALEGISKADSMLKNNESAAEYRLSRTLSGETMCMWTRQLLPTRWFMRISIAF